MNTKKELWWQRVSRFILKHIIGWVLAEEVPPTEKYVLIGAHHTSNWDWVIGVFMMTSLGLRPRWIGKDSLFRGIMGPFMRWTGGISVVRGAKKNFVGQIIDIYDANKKMVIALAPEGTRKKVTHWKTGFYYIAHGAQVFVATAFLDYKKKICGVGGYFMPSGNIEEDFEILKEFYADVTGKFPQNHGLVQVKV